MKYPTHKAAELLKMHPVNLVHYLASIGFSFDEVWPEIDKTLVETIKEHFSKQPVIKKAVQKPSVKKAEPKAVDTSDKKDLTKMGLSKNAGLILEKLYYNGKWGPVGESFDSLQRITNLSMQDLEESIDELKTKLLFVKYGEDNTYCLNPGKNSEIQHVLFSKQDG